MLPSSSSHDSSTNEEISNELQRTIQFIHHSSKSKDAVRICPFCLQQISFNHLKRTRSDYESSASSSDETNNNTELLKTNHDELSEHVSMCLNLWHTERRKLREENQRQPSAVSGSKDLKASEESEEDEGEDDDETDESDNHEHVFCLKSTNQKFIPRYKSIDEIVEDDRKMAVRLMWANFCVCARSKICQEMTWNNISTVIHKTLGTLPATIFYLFFHEQPGAQYYSWTQRKQWNGMTINEFCIQFKFIKKHPILHTHDDWANFTITSTQDNGDKEIGVIHRKKIFNLENITLTCNTVTNEVFSTFTFSRKMEAYNTGTLSKRITL
ncbi:hypothetical protein C9374_005585 [Naegleria lovaniensis]|uniref:Uncharacterized protein n=1 Tax=Naegleria lovaniensis TaxID=51637 RepID=A0AA88KJZ1_NAELO|nr:uncharacterized protein C9374_005585 [Naegleria lovaniensis]KAG2382383.1 hypothetical protein C9374_005585 [Naegleria lovaniensis]